MFSNESHMYSSYADPNTTVRSDKALSFGFGKAFIVEKEERISVSAQNECPENQGKLKIWQSNFNRFSFDNVKPTQRAQDFQFSRPTNVQQYYRKSQKKESTCSNEASQKNTFNFAAKQPRREFHKGEYCKQNQHISYRDWKMESNPESSQKGKSQEWRKERQSLDMRVKELQEENLHLKKEIEVLKTVEVDHELQLKKVRDELDDAYCFARKQKENIIFLELEKSTCITEIQKLKMALKFLEKRRNTLEITSNVMSLSFTPNSQLRKISQDSECQTQLGHSFVQDYSQAASFLGIRTILCDDHTQLLSKLKQIFQDISKKATKIAVLQLQKTKLKNHLRLNQMELSHLSSENGCLRQQLTKTLHLVDEYNEEINILHVRQIQQKIRFKTLKADDETEGSLSDE